MKFPQLELLSLNLKVIDWAVLVGRSVSFKDLLVCPSYPKAPTWIQGMKTGPELSRQAPSLQSHLYSPYLTYGLYIFDGFSSSS